MKYKRIYSIVATIAMIATFVLPAKAHDFEVDGIYYNITSSTDNTVAVTYQGNSYSEYKYEYTGDVVIPETVSYSDVTYSVTSIGSEAFRNCSGLTSVTIGNSVTEIGGYAFCYCSGLTSVTIPNSVTEIGGYAFYYCSGLTSVTIPDSVTSIGWSTFCYCSGLTSVTIGNSVSWIGNTAFFDCTGLTAVYISDLSAWCNISFNNYDSNPLYYAHNLYLNGELVTDLVISDSITKIKDYTFYEDSCLTSVTIGNSVTEIGYNAFSGCSNIKLVQYNAKNATINRTARISSVENIVFGETVETIPTGLFNDSKNAKTIVSKNFTPPVCNAEAFTNIDKTNCILCVPKESIADYWTADVWKDFANIRPISDEVVKAQSISLSQSSATLEPYQSVTLTYTILPENTFNKSVTWTSSDPSIAVVKVNNDNSASVLMLQKGSAIITATTNDGTNLSASCYVADSAGVDAIATDACSIAVENGAIVVKNGVGTVTVYNTIGVAAATAEADGNELRIENLQSGIYVVTIADKVVKVKL